MDKEESDTEDSFELEIAPQQLSQVTPGGGCLEVNPIQEKAIKDYNWSPKWRTRSLSNNS